MWINDYKFNVLSQTGPYDGGTKKDIIAHLDRFIPLERSAQEPDCAMAAGVQKAGNRLIRIIRPHYEMKLIKHTRTSNIIDAAVAKPVRPDLVTNEVLELGAVTGIAEPELGMTVRKSGRSSGLTEGAVTALGASLKVELDEQEYGWFTDQVVGDLVVNPGDSGSLVVNKENQAVGLVFAGSDQYSIFNRMDNVLRELKVTF